MSDLASKGKSYEFMKTVDAKKFKLIDLSYIICLANRSKSSSFM